MNTSVEVFEEKMLVDQSLVGKAKRRSGLAIANTFKEYTKSGGLRELENKVEDAREKCSSYIYGLAQWAADVPAKAPPADVFRALCLYAEITFKDKQGVTNVEDVVPVWKVYKSNILAGMRAGLDPREFETEWAFRKAQKSERITNQRQQQRRLQHSNEEEDTEDADYSYLEPTDTEQQIYNRIKPATRPHAIQQVSEWVASTTIQPPLKFLVSRLIVEAGYVRKGKEEDAEFILQRAVDELNKLIDRRRIRDEATRSVIDNGR